MMLGLAARNWPISNVLKVVQPSKVERKPAAVYRRDVYPGLIAGMYADIAQEWIKQSIRYSAELMTDISRAILGDAQAMVNILQKQNGLMSGTSQLIEDKLNQLNPPDAIGEWRIGQNLGPNRGQVIIDTQLFSLRYFAPRRGENSKGPILFVSSWINGAEIFDLVKDKSMVEALTRAGYEVFVTDWKEVNQENSEFAIFDRYVQQVLYSTLIIQELRKTPGIDILGYCIGGVLANVAAARLPGFYNRIINLATMMTSKVGQEGGGLLCALTDPVDIASLCGLYGGVIPGYIFASLFDLSQSESDGAVIRRRVANYWDRYMRGKITEQVDEYRAWSMLTMAGVGMAQATFVDGILRDDMLAQGRLEVLGERINLNNIIHPFLSIFSKKDHIIHPECAMATAGLIGTPLKNQVYVESSSGGHLDSMMHPDVSRFIVRFLEINRCRGQKFDNYQLFSWDMIMNAIIMAELRMYIALQENMLSLFIPRIGFIPTPWE
jgi:poly(3-hydroxyalkanoate) synthetase